MKPLIYWLIDLVIDCLIDWSINWLIEFLIYSDWLIDCYSSVGDNFDERKQPRDEAIDWVIDSLTTTVQ